MGLSDFRSKEFLAVLAAGFLLRAGFVVFFEHTPVSDEADYLRLAVNLSETGTYVIAGNPTAFRPVGYPAFLSVIASAAGSSITAIRIVQIVLDLSLLAGLFLLGNRYGERKGILAAFLWAVFPPAILYPGLIVTETLSTFLLVWLFVLLLNHERLSHPVAPVLAGIMGGMLALVKPWTLPFVIVVIPLFLAKRAKAKTIILFTGVALFLTVPWMARNYIKMGMFSLSTNTGINLFVGNNPGTTGAYKASFPDELINVLDDERAFDKKARDLAIQFIAENPARFLFNAGVKTANLFRTEGELLIWTFHPNLQDPSTGFAEKYRSVPLVTTVVVNAGYAVVLVLGLFGLVRFWRDDFLLLFALFTGLLVAIHAVFFGGSRYHFLLMPFLAVCSANVLPSLHKEWLRLAVSRRILLTIATALLLTLWVYELLYIF
ncbi:MAG TPA: glycosyltransferase family 39 protein [Bacteroidota bacterium]